MLLPEWLQRLRASVNGELALLLAAMLGCLVLLVWMWVR